MAGTWSRRKAAINSTSTRPNRGGSPLPDIPADDLAPGTLNSILKQAALKEAK